MSSIPLPALGVQPPRAPDLLGSVGQALAIKSQMGQQQLQQQSLQTSQLANQQTQQAIQLQAQKVKDQKTVTDLYVKNNGDLDQTIADAAKAGVTPETLQQLQLHSIDVKGKLLDLAGKQGAEATRQSDLMQGAYQQVATADPAQRPALYQQELMGLQRQGVDVSKMPVQYPGDQQFKILGATVQGYSKQLSQAVQQSEAAKNQGAATASQATAGKENAETQFYQNNPGLGAPGVPTETAEMYSALRGGRIKSPADFPGFKAGQDAAATMPFDIAKKKADQAIADGDPNAAAQLLTSGSVAPSQIISSRKPAFAQAAFSAAKQLDPTWNAQKAEGDFKVASSPANVAFFGSAKSLTDKGGTLDQLAAAAKDIPDNQIPIFNSVADAVRASTGSGPVAKYASLALGVADDYSKVMGGGQGSDTSRTQALNLIAAKQSPEQRAAAIEGIRGAVGSQTGSRIGNNSVLKNMYGSAQTAPSAETRTYQGHTYSKQPDGSWKLTQ